MIALQIVAAWLLADAMSGLAHWILDRRLRSGGRFASLVEDNVQHHARPEGILEFTHWQNVRGSLLSIGLAGMTRGLGAPLIVWLAFVFLFFGNLVHRWAHERRDQIPYVVRVLQRLGIFQSPAHHALHHRCSGRLVKREESTRRYCVMSNYMNALLEWRPPE